jgi:uncharacterized protein (TIGR02145 family)
MAENLNYEPDFNRGVTGQCPEAGVYRCEGNLAPEKCGAFYDWAMVLDLVEGYWPGTDYTEITVPGNLINSPHVGIAPEGWHIPTQSEVNTLISYLGGSSAAAKKLASSEDWSGTNESGFNAYPADYVGVS